MAGGAEDAGQPPLRPCACATVAAAAGQRVQLPASRWGGRSSPAAAHAQTPSLQPCARRQVVDTERFEVVCVSPRNHFLFTPMLPRCAVAVSRAAAACSCAHAMACWACMPTPSWRRRRGPAPSRPPPPPARRPRSTAVGTVEFRSLLEPVRVANPFVDYFEATCDRIDLDAKVAYCTSKNTCDGLLLGLPGCCVGGAAAGTACHAGAAPRLHASAVCPFPRCAPPLATLTRPLPACRAQLRGRLPPAVPDTLRAAGGGGGRAARHLWREGRGGALLLHEGEAALGGGGWGRAVGAGAAGSCRRAGGSRLRVPGAAHHCGVCTEVPASHRPHPDWLHPSRPPARRRSPTRWACASASSSSLSWLRCRATRRRT